MVLGDESTSGIEFCLMLLAKGAVEYFEDRRELRDTRIGTTSQSLPMTGHPLIAMRGENHLRACGERFTDEADMMRKFAVECLKGISLSPT